MSRFVRQLKKDWPAVEHAVAKRLEQWSQRRAHQSIEYVEGGKSTEEPARSSLSGILAYGGISSCFVQINEQLLAHLMNLFKQETHQFPKKTAQLNNPMDVVARRQRWTLGLQCG